MIEYFWIDNEIDNDKIFWDKSKICKIYWNKITK